MKYKPEIKFRLYSSDFRYVEFNIWKKDVDLDGYVMKIHTKLPLTLHTWKICLKGFPGSMYVNWKSV
jgi:hypothetical protein